MTPRPHTSVALTVLALALGLPGPRAAAHPLFRLHVRPSAYRIAPPRLPSVRLPSVSLPSVVRGAAALAPVAGPALAGPASAARVAAQGAAALNLLRHR